ncbi:hypothetical protein CAAN3_01S15236 [[Candida] anglica]
MLRFVRYISISQSAVVPGSVSATLPTVTSAPSLVQSSEQREAAEFQILGQPSTVLTVHSPPSYPINLKKGALLSIYSSNGTSMSSIRAQLEFLSPFKAFLFGGRSFQFQKFVSTNPYSILVSSSTSSFWSRAFIRKSFSVIHLDGSNDWAVLPKDALQVYAGPSLGVSFHNVPKTISKKLASANKIPPNTPTGLFSWKDAGFTLLTGRGTVGVVGNGEVYSVNLIEGEEILINKKNLLAATVNGPHDLQNFIVKYSVKLTDDSSNKPSPLPSSTSNNSYLTSVKKWWNKLTSLATFTKISTYNLLVGNGDYLKVIGPRTLLLQTSDVNVNVHENEIARELPVTESLLSTEKNLQRNAADYLNYVTITEKGAVFTSTPSFSDTVKQLEKK